MAEMVTIAVDALGGDFGPSVVLPGVEAALAQEANLQVLLCGPEEIVVPFSQSHDRCEAVPCTEEISMGEHPANAVRKKKDSSIVVGCRAVKEGKAQGFFSAGSTGACLAAGTLVAGRIKGVQRPALGTILPSPVKPVVMCDVGANADCKPEYLLQFAKMATIYTQQLLGRQNPSVGLLNIGSEETKGSQFAQDCFQLFSRELPNFKGNCEGCDVLTGDYDIIVTDGFTGNVCIKTIEGTSKMLMNEIKGVFKKNAMTMLAAAAVKGGLSDLKQTISADTYGGAPLLGVRGACLVGHGSSNETAIKNGIITAFKTVELRVAELIAESMVAEKTKAHQIQD